MKSILPHFIASILSLFVNLVNKSDKERMFFSEEKNQKTFTSPPLPRSRPWPARCRSAGNKSLFASFSSEKEDSS
jgi:hypothetical protein